MMKSFTRKMRQVFALMAALLFVYAARAQQLTAGDFVVAYTFPSGASDVQFLALTSGTVNYTYQVFNGGTPTGSSGAGSFTVTNSSVSLANTLAPGNTLTINPGDSIVISFDPTNLKRFYNFNSTGSPGTVASTAYLTDVLQWGNVQWSSMNGMFENCTGLKNISATDAPNLTGVTDMSAMFENASAFNGDLNSWNTDNITNMANMFSGANAFNGDISDWNTDNVTSMSGMFYNATVFNQDISGWNTGNVTTMQNMFFEAAAFDSDISGWNTGKVTNMNSMFAYATAFNQEIGNWNTANVTNMNNMFEYATAFDGDISGWNTSNVTNMNGMFYGASAFNQNINYNPSTGSWNTANVTIMTQMFAYASAFNQDISGWNTSNVTNMYSMFYDASAFNQNINYNSSTGSWNTANVTNMSNMFSGATVFNGDISDWNTAKVTSMSSMFYNAKAFNQNINYNATTGSWNTANVTNMSGMFYGASAFNEDISGWNTTNVTNMGGMFNGASSFNQNIGNWNTANVTSMSGMFNNATAFNGDISGWNTSNVTNMSSMFNGATAFNRDVSKWNTAKVTNMQDMFESASAFNQNLGGWNLSSIPASSTTAMDNMINYSGLNCTNYSLTLQGWAANLGSTTPTGIILSNPTSRLSYIGNTATITARTNLTTATNAGGGGWTIVDNGSTACAAALPINLLNFTAQKQGNTAQLQWQTATESNNKGFAVQRSTDGQNWQTIGFVNSKAANGNSAQPLSYQYTDNAPLSGTNYYRLQQQTLDGNVGFSSIVNINFGILQPTVHPNPAVTQFTVTVGTTGSYQLINIGGSIVLKGSLKAGDNTIHVSHLAGGVYVLRVVTGNSVKTYKVLVKK